MSDQARDTRPISNNEEGTYTVKLYEEHGHVVLGGSIEGVPQPYRCQIGLYSDGFPSDPNADLVDWCWLNDAPKETDQAWGSGWYVAMSYIDKDNDNYQYVVKAGPTE